MYTFEPRLVVTDTSTGKQWTPTVRYIDGYTTPFYTVDKYDRVFSLAIGGDTTPAGTALRSFTLIEHIRDATVDKLIAEAMGGDPGRELICDLEMRTIGGRVKLFRDACVPEVIAIKMPALTNKDWAVGATELHVVATDRRGLLPTIMLDNTSLTWLTTVGTDELASELPRRRIPKRERWDTLPPLPKPLKYRKRGDTLSIWYEYVDVMHEWRTRQKSVGTSSTPAPELELLIEEVSKLLMASYEANVGASTDGGGDAHEEGHTISTGHGGASGSTGHGGAGEASQGGDAHEEEPTGSTEHGGACSTGHDGSSSD